MNYDKTIIIEANYKNRLNANNHPNDFSVRCPNIMVPKGSTLTVDGSVIQEPSASNETLIELKNTNLNKNQPYTSSKAGMRISYYLNNNGNNMVVMPFVCQNLQYETGTFNTTPRNVSWVVPKLESGLNGGIQNMSGFHDNVSVQNRFHYQMREGNPYPLRREWICYQGKEEFMTLSNQPTTTDDGWTGDPTTTDYPNNMASPACVKTALIRNNPDGKKYTLVNAGYAGPDAFNRVANYNGKDILFDFGDNLLETVDEITNNVNNSLNDSKFNDLSNHVPVYDWNTGDAEYNDDTNRYEINGEEIDNVSGNTIINIPANFQELEFNKGQGAYENKYYSNMLVANSKRWEGGHRFLQSIAVNDFKVSTNIGNWTLGTRPSDGESLFNVLFRNYGVYQVNPNAYELTKEYPVILGASINALEDPYNFNFITQTHGGFINIGNQSLPVFHIRDVDVFSQPVVDEPIISPYFAVVWEPLGVEKYLMGIRRNELYLVLADDDGSQTIPVNLPNGQPDVRYILELDKITALKLPFVPTKTAYSSLVLEVNGGSIDFNGENCINGLPYYPLDSSHPNRGTTDQYGGGDLCEDMPDNAAPINAFTFGVDDFLAIPKNFVIPTNLTYTPKGPPSVPFTQVLEKIQLFFRLNEKYYGTETEYNRIQADAENWGVEWDLGLADDNLNAWSRLFSKGQYKHVQSETNFSMIPSYYPNIQSLDQQEQNADNYTRPMSIYPISRYARMGCNTQSRDNHLVIKSRYYPNYQKDWVRTNIDLDFDFERKQALHPSIHIIEFDDEIAKQYNLPLLNIEYAGTEGDNGNYSIGFMSLIDTLKGNGMGKTDYTGKADNFHTSFRVCAGCNCGFDPASTTNPFGCPINKQQIIGNTNNYSKFKLNLTQGVFRIGAGPSNYIIRQYPSPRPDPVYGMPYTIEWEFPSGNKMYGIGTSANSGEYWRIQNYNGRAVFNVDVGTGVIEFVGLPALNGTLISGSIPDISTRDNVAVLDIIPQDNGNDDYRLYSSFITDYINNVYIGAVYPKLVYDNLRFQFKDFHTPKKWNYEDSGGSGVNVGNAVVVFNNDKSSHGAISYIMPNDIEKPRGDKDDPTWNENLVNGNLLINYGIDDSISGIGIRELYVLDENDKRLTSTINEDGTTTNFEGGLWSTLGFEMRQFKPFFGSELKRYNIYTYNETSIIERYEGIDYFTTNAIVSQQQAQLLSLFGINRTDNPTMYDPDNVGSLKFQGQQDFKNGYTGVQKLAILAESESLVAEHLPNKLLSPFFTIETTLPTPEYVIGNTVNKILAYNYRQYKNGDYYYNYSSSYNITIKEPLMLTEIRTIIRDSDGELARNLGENATVFYKLSIPQKLAMINIQDINRLVNHAKANTVIRGGKPLVMNDTIQVGALEIPEIGINTGYRNPSQQMLNDAPLGIPTFEGEARELISDIIAEEPRARDIGRVLGEQKEEVVEPRARDIGEQKEEVVELEEKVAEEKVAEAIPAIVGEQLISDKPTYYGDLDIPIPEGRREKEFVAKLGTKSTEELESSLMGQEKGFRYTEKRASGKKGRPKRGEALVNVPVLKGEASMKPMKPKNVQFTKFELAQRRRLGKERKPVAPVGRPPREGAEPSRRVE